MTSKLILRNVTESKAGPRQEIASVERLESWITSNKDEPLAFWDLGSDLFSARFALGGGEAGGVMIANADGDEPYYYLVEGDLEGDRVQAKCDGYEMPVPGVERTTPERLFEVLSHLMEHGEVGPGKWESEAELTRSELVDLAKLDPGMAAVLSAEAKASKGPPQARGHYTKALVELVLKQALRKTPLAEVLALIRKAGDGNLRAYLHAYAHHDASDEIDCGDWVMETPELQNKDIFVGKTYSGDHYLMRGNKAIVLLHETGEEEKYVGFEGLLSDLVFRAHDRGQGTDLDAITGEEPH